MATITVRIQRHRQYTTAILMLLIQSHLTMCNTASQDHHGQCPTLYLLNVQPYPVSTDESAPIFIWDKAFELIPAGHLATEQINNRSDILPGYELKLIDIDSEACRLNVISKGITNVYRQLVNPNQTCIVGVIGLYCSAVTSAISPIISHPNIGGYAHIAASTSPVHREGGHSKDPQPEAGPFYIIESSSAFNEATLALMRTYNWQRITSVHTESEYFFMSTSINFIDRVSSSSEYELVTSIPIVESDSLQNNIMHIQEKFNIIREKGARISYWSVTPDQAAFLLCVAYQRNFTWPGYIYIIQEHNVDQILEIETSCSKEEILRVMEGVFILSYRLYVENKTELVSGVNYSEFKQLYTDKLKEFANIKKETLQTNLYANSLYDQVWAFALAINKSLTLIKSQNLSFEDHGLGKGVPNISNILKNEFRHVSFQGASGWIDFSENQESPTFVNIFQIRKGKPQLIGVYNPYSRNVTLTEAAYHVGDVPRDTLKIVYQLLPPWLGVCMLAAQGLIFELITTNLFLILKWKNEKDIKAISPLLSLLMMIGCYSLCLTPVFLIAHRMFVLNNMAVVKSLCYLRTWTSMGTDLILAVLFLKLLRVYHIFQTFGKTSRCWSDQYLFIYTLAICAGKAVLVIIWNSTGSVHLDIHMHQEYVQRSDKLPYYVATVTCSHTAGVWLIATGLYSDVLLFLVVMLAVATRHIKKENFKDTKKVNAFIALVGIITITTNFLEIIFRKVDNQTGADIAEWLPSFAIPLLCQVCLFAPKTLPLTLKKMHKFFSVAN